MGTQAWNERHDSSDRDPAMYMFRSLFVLVPLWYAFYYTFAAVLTAAYDVHFNGLEPFEHVQFSPAPAAGDDRALVAWLSMVLTATLPGPLLIYFVAQDHHRAVDCTTALYMLQLFATVAATQLLPRNWIWWCTVMPCMVFQGRVAEFCLWRFGYVLAPGGRRVTATTEDEV